MPTLQFGDNLEPDSNVREESDPHLEKQSPPKTSTDAGRVISTKPVSKSVDLSIRDNVDLDSNIADESGLHKEKQSSSKNATL
jgi:hypothetical protein